MLESNGCHSLINRATRYSLHSKPSLLDHIYSNNTTHDKVCGVCLYDISDHLPTFITLKKYNYICINNDTALTRCMKNFNAERFIEGLSTRLHAMKDTIFAPSNLDSNFSSFIFLFLDVLKYIVISSFIVVNKKPHTIAEELLMPAAKVQVKHVIGIEAVSNLNSILLSNNAIQRRIVERSPDIN